VAELKRCELETSEKSASRRGRSVVPCASTGRRGELGLSRTVQKDAEVSRSLATRLGRVDLVDIDGDTTWSRADTRSAGVAAAVDNQLACEAGSVLQ
jgi:hypothetical protein